MLWAEVVYVWDQRKLHWSYMVHKWRHLPVLCVDICSKMHSWKSPFSHLIPVCCFLQRSWSTFLSSQEIHSAMDKSSGLMRHSNSVFKKKKKWHICHELPPDLLEMRHFKYFMLSTKYLEEMILYSVSHTKPQVSMSTAA